MHKDTKHTNTNANQTRSAINMGIWPLDLVQARKGNPASYYIPYNDSAPALVAAVMER